MSTPMGLANVKLAFKAASEGRLARRRSDGTWQTDNFSRDVLTYMCAYTFDWNDAPDGKCPRCYMGGWKQIAEDLGLIVITSTRNGQPVSLEDRRAQYNQRLKTVQPRISRAFAVLKDAGLISCIRPARFGLNAVYALTIGSDEENETLIRYLNAKYAS